MEETKFCKHCGEKIPYDAVICTKCGRQVEKMEREKDPIIINNNNNNNNNNNDGYVYRGVKFVSKWVSFALCLFLGWIGAHKFYEGKIGLGIIYMMTFGLFFLGWVIDIFVILTKPDPYAV